MEQRKIYMLNLHIFLKIPLSSNSQSSESFEHLLITRCIMSNYNWSRLLHFCAKFKSSVLFVSNTSYVIWPHPLLNLIFGQFLLCSICCSQPDLLLFFEHANLILNSRVFALPPSLWKSLPQIWTLASFTSLFKCPSSVWLSMLYVTESQPLLPISFLSFSFLQSNDQ